MLARGLGLLFVFFLVTAKAQSWQPKCSEVLGLEPNAFISKYLERNSYRGDSRPVAEIAAIWQTCQQAANNAKLKGNPKLQERIKNLQQLEITFFASEFTFALINGGFSGITGGVGSDLADQETRFAMFLEQHLGKVIELALSKAGAVTSTSIKDRYQKAKAAIENRIRKNQLGALKNVEPAYLEVLKTSMPNFITDWDTAAKQQQQAYSSIYKLVGQPVDSISMVILEFLAKGYY